MSELQTDLSLNPYFDDFNPDSNQYAVLFKPSLPVQVRELNSLQSILQDQITKFGRNVFQEGSVIDGCSFTFDNNYTFVKINDNYSNGAAFTISDFVGRVVYNKNGLQATIINATQGLLSQAPALNTLYIKYLNSGTYSNSAQQSTFDPADTLVIASTANVAVGNVAVASNTGNVSIGNVTGSAYAMTVTEGTIFKKGYFIRFPTQTAVVTPYSNVPDGLSVGFGVIESVDTALSNTALLDNAAGAPNYSSPGADRLVLTPNLVVRATSNTSNTSDFFSVCDFSAGKPVTIKNDPQLSSIGKQLAQTVYETNGDFVVNPFILSVKSKVPSDPLVANTLNLISSPGLGYVKGYRVDFLNNSSVNLRKGTDTESFLQHQTSLNFGYYVIVYQLVGDFNNQNLAQVELHNDARMAVSNTTYLATSYSSSSKIGTAYVRGIELNSGTPGFDATYLMYLFDIQMSAGYSFSQTKSIVLNNGGGTVGAVADVVLTYNYSTNTNIAQIQEIINNTNIYPFGQKAIVANGFNNTSYIYRNRSNTTFSSTGNTTITIPAPVGTGTENFIYSGTLSYSQAGSFEVIPTINAYSSNNTGTVTISSSAAANGSSQIVGSGTTFTSKYSAGDVIYVSNTTTSAYRQIVSIVSDTSLYVDAPFASNTSTMVHQEFWPAGLPIPFVNRPNRSISISGTTATLNLGTTTNGAFNVSTYYDVDRSATVPISKVINRGTLVRINLSNNVGGVSGPWCLGVPDVFKLNHVWVCNSTSGYVNTGIDAVSSFNLDNGQRDGYYGLGYISSNTALANTTLLLVSIDHFTYNQTQGVGFFTANSYPIDDINTSNAAAITTAQIPVFTSPTKGTTFDLRDSADFRPFAANTAAANNSFAANSVNVNPSAALTFSVLSSGAHSPSPNYNFVTDLAHYLPRIDRVSLTTSGQMIVTEGIPSITPAAPPEPPRTMTLGSAYVPPYPTLAPSDAASYKRYDYSVTTSLSQNQRYTMANIKSLDDRISSLEYYTSLSQLEQATASTNIVSSVTGQNRFQNGILVDPFAGFNITNTLDPTFLMAIDVNAHQARPYFEQHMLGPYVDSISDEYSSSGSVVSLPYTATLFQSQPYASKYRNCVEGNVFDWVGTMSLSPSGDTSPDTKVAPDVVNNLDLASNFVNLSATQGWGTTWGNWVTTSSNSVSTQTATAPTTSYNPDGSSTTVYGSQINTTTTLNQTQTGTQLSVTTSNTQLNLGTFVQNVSILPYIVSRSVFFSASGMKPSTKLYSYFNSTPVSNSCVQLTLYTGSVSVNNNSTVTSNGYHVYTDSSNNNYTYNSTSLGTGLSSDANGNVYGIFVIPGKTFQAGDLTFQLADVSSLVQGANAIQTQASATYVGSGLSISLAKSVLNTQKATVALAEVVNTKTIQQNTVTAGPPLNVVYTPAPYVPPSYDYGWSGGVVGDWGSGGGGGGNGGAGGGGDGH